MNPANGEGLLFYMKLRDWVDAGKSIARWPSPEVSPERVQVQSGDEPTLLFPAGDVEPVSAAVGHAGHLYAYDCSSGCLVGRAPFDTVFDRGSWTFYAGGGQWTPDWKRAAQIMDAARILSVHYNAFLEQFIAVYAGSGSRAVLRTAPAPQGPWSDELELAELIPPIEGDFGVYDVIAHGELFEADGRRVYFSYSRGTAPFQSEMRLVRVDLAHP